MLKDSFYDRDACLVAKQLLGKVIYRKLNNLWLKVRIIETEAYYITEKASHSSLGKTPSRRAMFMPPGTIYMYYCRGRDTLNISVKGKGNAVLIKSGFPCIEQDNKAYTNKLLKIMRSQYNDLNRPVERLCNGQTLLCQALDLKVSQWNENKFNQKSFYISDDNIKPNSIITTTRLGIATGRDHDLPYRFIDQGYNRYCTKPIRSAK